MSQKQTVSYLVRRFREVGLEPDTRHGQNFLIDMNLLRVLVEAADVGPQDVVLEVGTGTGGLTGLLAQHAAAVVTVEIDRRLHQMASEELVECDNVTMLLHDALRNKNNMDPRVLDTISQQLAAGEDRRLKLVSNLPYNIATPVISNLLSTPIVPRTMTVTIQKELADRITARPSTKDYGHLSIWIQCQCHAHVVRALPPTVFWPKPKVESAIIQIELDEAKRQGIADLEFFHSFVRAMFFHRRKFLRSVILSAFKKRLTKPQVDEILAGIGLRGDQRAEQLSVQEMILLSDTVQAKLGGGEE